MTKTSNLPGKREQQKEARRIAIIDAALEEFTAQGFTAAKLDDVAVRAGIGKGTIYLYFDSKESLFKEVVRRNMMPGEELREKFDNFVQNYEGSASTLLETHFRNMYQFMQDEKIPPLIAMLFGEAVRFPELSRFFHDEVIRVAQEMLRRIIRRGVESGEFRESALELYTQLMIAPVLIGALWKLQFQEFAPLDMEHYVDMHIDYLLRALKA